VQRRVQLRTPKRGWTALASGDAFDALSKQLGL